jgi:hypothetical protein
VKATLPSGITIPIKSEPSLIRALGQSVGFGSLSTFHHLEAFLNVF